MSEEILRSLAQLFAIITKQDGGVIPIEREFVYNYFRKKLNLATAEEYIALYEDFLKDGETKEEKPEEGKEVKKKLTSVKDSVRTLGICRKINKTLTLKQKIVVLVELLEILILEGKSIEQKQEIIDTVATAFNIEKEEYKILHSFIAEGDSAILNHPEIIAINATPPEQYGFAAKHLSSEYLNGNVFFARIVSVDMIFMKYTGEDELTLNGLIVAKNDVVLFSPGSTARSKLGGTFYYSDILSNFISDTARVKLSFNVKGLEYRFPNQRIGLRNVNISEASGKLIGIMGASGAGKTTLLNVLAGLESPSKGEVLINGINIHKNQDKIRGIIGYIPQDDLLIEELSVYENLFYSAKLCFKDKSDEEISQKVLKLLQDLGLMASKDLKVGNPLNKSISGGQRKRLNIALELIREPLVLFVDEPTSGLSSRDSENVMDLLKELTLKGTLIFIVIHQPSSDIYKMFDKMIILDVGGFPIYYSNPVEAITYFKRVSQQADSDKGQCPTCGNVNPEQIFNIIEERVVDEYGTFTTNRRLTPTQWNESYLKNYQVKFVDDIKEKASGIFQIPNKLKQLAVFATRDFKSKLKNTSYMVINLVEAPLLAFILAFILRYNNANNNTSYLLRYNDNFPAYIFMSIIIAIFIGLSISAEEIIKDKKILKRETFLNLSRNSYLISKVFILFAFSAIQTLLFVLVGNTILGIENMYLSYWMVLFAVACFANMTGLIISSAFDTAVTVYILVPLLLIPQMILSGAIFSFDKINDSIRSYDKVPLVADFIASRWAYEAIAVKQFRDNAYQKNLYPLEQKEILTNYNIVYLIPELRERLDYARTNLSSRNDSVLKVVKNNFTILKFELQKQVQLNDKLGKEHIESLTLDKFNDNSYNRISAYLTEMEGLYNQVFNRISKDKDLAITLLNQIGKSTNYVNTLKDNHFNESLSDLVRNATAKKRIIDAGGYLTPKIDYIYFKPVKISNPLDYRAHFFAPYKQFLGKTFDSFYFNISVIWISIVLLYLLLYFDLLKHFLNIFGKISVKKVQQ